MARSKREFYLVDRQMITVLGLRGDTLAVYALIASFSMCFSFRVLLLTEPDFRNMWFKNNKRKPEHD